MRPLAQLAALAADWRQRPLSDEVRAAVRLATLDWFATMLPGTRQAPATLLAAGSLGAGSGNAVCYVTGRRVSPRAAAFVNATASHTVEFDDIFRDAGYHPGSPTIAAALALAQDIGATRDQFDRAVIAGYEVGCRLALALQPSHYEMWHITSTVGTMGAAAAGAMLLGCGAEGIANAIAIASSFAGGHQQNLLGDSMAKAMHPGHAADAGLLAAYAAAAGATGAADSLDGARGYAAATSAGTGNWDAAFEGAGDWTPITRMTVKIHGCCGHIFTALDALEALRAEHGFAPEDIAALRVEGYGATKTMCDRPEPRGAQEARFSLQYCLAAQMVLGQVRLAAFERRSAGRSAHPRDHAAHQCRAGRRSCRRISAPPHGPAAPDAGRRPQLQPLSADPPGRSRTAGRPAGADREIRRTRGAGPVAGRTRRAARVRAERRRPPTRSERKRRGSRPCPAPWKAKDIPHEHRRDAARIHPHRP